MKFKKMHGMEHGNFEEKHFFKEIVEELNLSKNQKEKLKQLKKVAIKDKFKVAVKFILGKANYETMGNLFIEKIEAGEKILTEDQKTQLKNFIFEKHRKFFTTQILLRQDELKDLIEQLELDEEQKEKVETFFTAIIDGEECEKIFKLKHELKESLSDNQKDKIHGYIKENTPLGKICEELEITEEQKKKFKDLHENNYEEKIETIKKFKIGEISFADMARKKSEMFKEIKSVLTDEQLKKLKSMHREHCHCHKYGHHQGHRETC